MTEPPFEVWFFQSKHHAWVSKNSSMSNRLCQSKNRLLVSCVFKKIPRLGYAENGAINFSILGISFGETLRHVPRLDAPLREYLLVTSREDF